MKIIKSKRPRVVCFWNASEVKEIKIQYEKKNKENLSDDENKQTKGRMRNKKLKQK